MKPSQFPNPANYQTQGQSQGAFEQRNAVQIFQWLFLSSRSNFWEAVPIFGTPRTSLNAKKYQFRAKQNDTKLKVLLHSSPAAGGFSCSTNSNQAISGKLCYCCCFCAQLCGSMERSILIGQNNRLVRMRTQGIAGDWLAVIVLQGFAVHLQQV